MQGPIQFFVAGLAKPGGSKRAFPLGPKGREKRRPDGSLIINVVDAADNAEWKRSVSYFAAQTYADRPLLDGPIMLECRFVMPRPRGHFGTGNNADVLKAKSPKFHTNMPDALKLTRALEDALTGVVWVDDSLICRELIEKVYGDKPGVHVRITALTEETNQPAADEIVSAMPLFTSSF